MRKDKLASKPYTLPVNRGAIDTSKDQCVVLTGGTGTVYLEAPPKGYDDVTIRVIGTVAASVVTIGQDGMANNAMATTANHGYDFTYVNALQDWIVSSSLELL
jgi:hypothetical protein